MSKELITPFENEKGMSLAGTLVAVAIMGVIAAGTASLINTSIKGQRAIDVRHGLGELQRSVYDLLEGSETCSYNFGSAATGSSNDLGRTFQYSDFPRTITKLTNTDGGGSNVDVYLTDNIYEDSRVRIVSMQLSGLTPVTTLPTAQLIATLTMTLEANGQVSGPSRFIRTLQIRYVFDTAYTGSNNPTVQSCYSVGGVANQLWSKNSNQSIHYTGGPIGIGTDAPSSALEVNGAARNASAIANSSTTIDFDTGNIQYTSLSCRTFNLHNLKDGGAYTFIIQNTSSATCSFNAFSDAGSTALTAHMPSGHGATEAGEHTLYTAIVAGSHVYFAWVTEFD